jgi:hypothetical protein
MRRKKGGRHIAVEGPGDRGPTPSPMSTRAERAKKDAPPTDQKRSRYEATVEMLRQAVDLLKALRARC